MSPHTSPPYVSSFVVILPACVLMYYHVCVLILGSFVNSRATRKAHVWPGLGLGFRWRRRILGLGRQGVSCFPHTSTCAHTGIELVRVGIQATICPHIRMCRHTGIESVCLHTCICADTGIKCMHADTGRATTGS
jgi:hypothetical protein